MPHLTAETALILLLVVLLAIQTIRLLWLRGRAARQITQSRRLGEEGERRAEALLCREGYEILETQTTGGYHLTVDGTPRPISLRADFITKKGGRVLLAEVKAGAESASVTQRATRRQLLEYTLAFRVDGVLLVDVARERIIEVRFPRSEKPN